LKKISYAGKKSAWAVMLDMGITYAVKENVQFNIGMNVGVTKAADDFQPFLAINPSYG
jgi:hypothetical protein